MSIRRSIATNYVLSIVGTVVFIAGSMVVNRILTPAEIGVFTIAQSVSLLLMSIQQLGINHYIVREPTMSPEKLGSSALLLAGQGLLLCLLVAVSAPLVADFQRIPELQTVVLILAVSMLFWPLDIFCNAVLSRELKFATIATASLVRTTVSAGVGVYAAVLGYGPVGLAIATLLSIAAGGLFALVWAWPHIHLRWTLAHWREPFSFGMVNMAIVLARMGSTRGLDFLLGRLLGASAVGFFSRGTSLIEMTLNYLFGPLVHVFLPTVTKAKAESYSSYIWSIRRFNRAMLGLDHPFFALLAVFSGPVISVFFGPQWEPAQPLLTVLCVAQMIRLACRGVDQVAIVEGKRRGILIVDLTRMVILLGSLLVVYEHGLIWVACLKIVDSTIVSVCYIAILRRIVDISVRDILLNNLQGLTVAFGTVLPGAVYMHANGWPYSVPFLDLVLLAAASGAAWLVSLRLTRHVLSSEVERALRAAASRFLRRKGD